MRWPGARGATLVPGLGRVAWDAGQVAWEASLARAERGEPRLRQDAESRGMGAPAWLGWARGGRLKREARIVGFPGGGAASGTAFSSFPAVRRRCGAWRTGRAQRSLTVRVVCLALVQFLLRPGGFRFSSFPPRRLDSFALGEPSGS